MKITLLFVVIAGVFYNGVNGMTSEQKEIALEHAKECITETEADPNIITMFHSGEFAEGDPKCFTKCFFEKCGLLDGEGQFQPEVAIDNLTDEDDKEAVEAAVNSCKDEAGENDCEKIFNIFKCVYKARHPDGEE